MAVYTSTSVKEIIGRVLRNTKMTDISYADDIIEWLGEGTGRLMIRWRLAKKYQTLKIENYMAKMPCGLQALNGVLYNGYRLRRGLGVVDPRIQPLASFPLGYDGGSDTQFYFKSSTNPEDVNSQDLPYIRGTDIKPLYNGTSAAWYDLDLDYIKTSFKDGYITIFFRAIDTDEEGYPLVPNVEEAKQALFWYVMGQLAMSGYKHNDPRMDYVFCATEAERFFRKAKNIIKRSSLDEKESIKNAWVTLIPPNTYYEQFSIGAEQRKYVQ